MERSHASGQQELMGTFREEVRGLTEEMADLLLAAGTKLDPAGLHRLRRAAHSIKGSSQLVGFDCLSQTAGAMEKAFLAVQEGTLRLSPEVVALLREAVAACRRLLASGEDEQEEDLLERLVAAVHPQRKEGISS